MCLYFIFYLDSTETDSPKLSTLWIAVISASSAVFGFIVIVTTIFLIRKQMTNHKPKENLGKCKHTMYDMLISILSILGILC